MGRSPGSFSRLAPHHYSTEIGKPVLRAFLHSSKGRESERVRKCPKSNECSFQVAASSTLWVIWDLLLKSLPWFLQLSLLAFPWASHRPLDHSLSTVFRAGPVVPILCLGSISALSSLTLYKNFPFIRLPALFSWPDYSQHPLSFSPRAWSPQLFSCKLQLCIQLHFLLPGAKLGNVY